jgi:hypothetical protein
MSDQTVVLDGMKVRLELVDETGGREYLSVQLVADEYADLTRGFLGASTPLGRAIFGQTVGTTLDYRMDDIVAVKILFVEPSDDSPDPAVARRREETLRKAADQSERTNAILFASSFNGKWGDYDPGSLVDEAEKDK